MWMKLCTIIVIKLMLIVYCQAYTPIFPRCPQDNRYAPCQCVSVWPGYYIQISCDGVDPRYIRLPMKTVENENKIVTDISIKNSNSKLPYGFLGRANVKSLTLNMPNLLNLTPKLIINQRNTLQKIHILNSKLRSIPIKALASVMKLYEITVNGISLPKLTDKTFRRLRNSGNIKYLNLENNGIEVIGRETFSKFVKLENLILENNKLTELSVYSLPAHKLETLDLSGNQLKQFPLQLLTKIVPSGTLSLAQTNLNKLKSNEMKALFASKSYIYIRQNKLDCDCTFKLFAEKLEINPYNYYINGKCNTPSKLKNREVYSLKLDDFKQCN